MRPPRGVYLIALWTMFDTGVFDEDRIDIDQQRFVTEVARHRHAAPAGQRHVAFEDPQHEGDEVESDRLQLPPRGIELGELLAEPIETFDLPGDDFAHELALIGRKVRIGQVVDPETKDRQRRAQLM